MQDEKCQTTFVAKVNFLSLRRSLTVQRSNAINAVRLEEFSMAKPNIEAGSQSNQGTN
jgi:hypothetical protein